ncbi:selenocysteine-specific translation elongation factor [Nocardioides mesophilus]|uniref:Selenocysteine-specific translation elongation factor n=1 Tax=Nocardioides mesophilus TaxID=433659 RepID=A0A7G9R9W9_9ACTN|nr:selenocysteine-specific translation elongation factor [Nocardioides mesophilus]QNN52394.1 selenocysteine-specific translation elongation factor [Nocardioides mesophilus]
MYVVATAGHVDHGKSTLVTALTGSDPDRLEEEHRRGLTIELGYCWTELPGLGEVAFVDVPGHERFVSTMLAGIGPVPAVLFVVAADDPWMPQAAEHLAALDSLGVGHGVVAVTRSDLADPAPMVARVTDELARTSLRGSPVVPVSGRTGAGLDELRGRLATMLRGLPPVDPSDDVRLWVDRRFTIKGAGTVVTGTLPSGTVSRGDTLSVGGARVRVRGVQSLGRTVPAATGVARVALNLVGEDLSGLERGAALVSAGAWHRTDVLDVRLSGAATGPPERPMFHVGATAVGAHCRPLADDLVRLTLDAPLPLRVGDKALLRDPGDRRLWGVTVLDPAPPSLRRRGASRQRAAVLAPLTGAPDLASEVQRREVATVDLLRRIGVPVRQPPPGAVLADGWLMSADRADAAAAALAEAVARHAAAAPLDQALSVGALADAVGLPSPALVEAVVRPPLRVERGRVVAPRATTGLPPALEAAVDAVEEDLRDQPFAAPTADRLAELGLDARAVAAAVRAGRLLRVAPGIVLRPGAERTAVAWLAELEQPFTASQARGRLGTTRRVVLPLLDHLDRSGLTRRLPDDRRTVV